MKNFKSLKLKRGESNIIGSLFLILIVVVGAILVGYYVFGLISNNQAKTTMEILNENYVGGTLYLTLKNVGNALEDVNSVQVYHGNTVIGSYSSSGVTVMQPINPNPTTSSTSSLQPGQETVVQIPLSGAEPGQSVTVIVTVGSGQSENTVSQDFTLN
ncbi:archaellin/type IV pilin N-terminal domain-containing protein [Sulfuracidifex tepidarius]|uniref:Archaeal Type IV pilin N-terminal domain-containing protein n=1 Tax=Sulfuracidifex tepidarius TaxID=1294262 RepID=A0A510E059_9CREN|nr:archaellin/type IV pilin N-terminal domain-containing protein [Sulfuracidifex tepidarius]BBG23119.1 hypothetical protein IC006_0403 [Sulfuracidifex tepidarius]BBG25869.1 hypothetical protein IC007_0374 [Sulfuracidifex tepidarius]